LKKCSPPAAAIWTLIEQIGFRFIKINSIRPSPSERLSEHVSTG
jgi:hypothetical protein